MTQDQIEHARKRTRKLHQEVFGDPHPSLHKAAALFAWMQFLYSHGFGRDYSGHPRNPFKR